MRVTLHPFLLCAALFCACPAFLHAEEAPALLTVDQAVAAAIRNNLGVKSADAQSRIKKRASDFSFNKFYPSVSVSATALRLNEAPSGVAAAEIPGTSVAPDVWDNVYAYTADRNNLSLGLTVQEVFSPAYLGLMNQAAIDYQGSVIGKEKAEREIASAVKKFYYQLLVQKEAIGLTRSRLDNANERLRQAKVSYEVGKGTELNYLYAKTSAESIVPEVRSMETARMIALTKFQEILGFDKREDMELSGSLDDGTIPSEGALVPSGSRIDVSQSEIAVKQLKSALRFQDMTLFPNVILQYSADPTINGPKSGTLFERDNWAQSKGALSLTLSWNLTAFVPGSEFNVKRAELKDQLALASDAARTAAQNAAHDEEIQRRLIADSLAKIESLKLVVSDTERSYELTDASYKAGVGRYLDLQAAELAWQGTQIQLLNERLNLMSLVCDLEAKYRDAR